MLAKIQAGQTHTHRMMTVCTKSRSGITCREARRRSHGRTRAVVAARVLKSGSYSMSTTINKPMSLYLGLGVAIVRKEVNELRFSPDLFSYIAAGLHDTDCGLCDDPAVSQSNQGCRNDMQDFRRILVFARIWMCGCFSNPSIMDIDQIFRCLWVHQPGSQRRFVITLVCPLHK